MDVFQLIVKHLTLLRLILNHFYVLIFVRSFVPLLLAILFFFFFFKLLKLKFYSLKSDWCALRTDLNNELVWHSDSLLKGSLTVFLLYAFLRNSFLCQDRCYGDVPPHLAQPCCVALGRALDWGL